MKHSPKQSKASEEFIEAQLKAMTPEKPNIPHNVKSEVSRNPREPLFPHIPKQHNVLFPHR
jgi:hypothetical protein